jgi:hypothetical protein
MSDTPRTYAARLWTGEAGIPCYVPDALSAQLERELADVTAALLQCRDALATCQGGVEAIAAADAVLPAQPAQREPRQGEQAGE